MASIRVIILSFVVLIALLTIPVMIGVYVYRDAKRRGMNAMAWTLIAVVAPALIGLSSICWCGGIILTCNVLSVPSLSQSSTRSVPTAGQSCALPVPTAHSRWKWIGKCVPSALLLWRVWRCLLLHPNGSGTELWVKS